MLPSPDEKRTFWKNTCERMKTLAILSRKGGTGKTTLAVHLAVAAEKAGLTTAVIDLDPQASATKWADTRDVDSPVVISAHAIGLPSPLSPC